MIPPSIAPDPTLLRGAIHVLARIEGLPLDASGVLRYGTSGAILVEQRAVCWATAAGMENRFAELLRHQRNPPLERGFLESVIEQCKASGTPIGEGLLSSGQITEPGLRSAIFRQSVESIAHIAREHAGPPDFVPRAASSYAARFKFSTVEILAALGARRDHVQATVARQHLESIVTKGTAAAAFLESEESAAPEVVAVVNGDDASVETLFESSLWARNLFAIVSASDPTAFLAMGTWRGREHAAAAVAWRVGPLHFVALCPHRVAAAVLVGRLAEHKRKGTLE